MKKLLLLITTTCILISLNAQTAPPVIRGFVYDENKKPIEAATVSLLRFKDSNTVKVTICDKEGNFAFENIGTGTYFLAASSVGHATAYSKSFDFNVTSHIDLIIISLQTKTKDLKEVSVLGRKPFIEQKADRLVVNVDASPTSAGSSVLDILEKSPGVSVDKDGNISLKGKQGVTIMIDNKPTYLSAMDLSNYLKSLPSSAIEQLEIMTNPSAKYDAAGNSGIINIKTKKNKAKGINGSLTLTHTQGVYPKPAGSVNLNYKTAKANFFLNAGYNHWEGFQSLDINRKYLDVSSKAITSIFSQHTFMKFTNPSINLKLGMDYYLTKNTTIGIVLSGFENKENFQSVSTIFLKDPNQVVDSIVYSPSSNKGIWKNGSVNLNFRHQFDTTGRELTADIDFMNYISGSDQYFNNITYNPDWTMRRQSILTGNLPSGISIYSFKSDYSHPFKDQIKLEVGFKSSYVSTDNNANYFNVINAISQTDTAKTNHFAYHENINAIYLNLNKQMKKWSLQAGLRLENTNYSGHQFGNNLTVNKNDSSFQRSYISFFPTVYISYQASEKNQFALNYGRRIDRPAYQDLNPFLFFLDQYTYQAGNPYLQPQFTQNIELSHTYKNFLTTTLNYSFTKDFFSETFQQLGHATIVRNGNIGQHENLGLAVSAQVPIGKWWTAILYGNLNYNKFTGMLYGEYINVSATTFMANVNNQFKFGKGWGGEISGFYRSSGVEGQILVDPLGQAALAVSKQLLKDKANVKLGLRDIFYTGGVTGHINFQQTEASFHNQRDSRQLSISFTYRFGKPAKGDQPHRNTGGANDEQNRVKVGNNN